MRRKLLTVMLCVSAAGYATAGNRDLEVRPAGRELFEITPREIVTTIFRITNSTSERRLFVSEVELPEGWRVITEDFPFELGPNESITKLVSFFVPETTSAGRYKIRYLVRARKYPAIRDFYTMDVIVSPAGKEKELPEPLPYVIAGQEYKAYFSVINKSETENTISISVDSSEDIAFTVDARKFKLGPGQSKIITVTVKPDAKIAKKLNNRLRVTAQIGQDGKPETQASAVHSMEIVPRGRSTIEQSLRTISAQEAIREPGEKVKDKAALIELKKKVEDSNSASLRGQSEGNLRFILRPKEAKELLETEPRRIVTAVFRVTNPTGKKREFIPEVKLPQGWVLITKDFSFALSPNETDTKLVSFFVPQTTLAGKYEITYVIKDRKYPSIRDFYTTYVIVLPVSRLQAKLLESPKFVIAGEEYKSSFMVTNQGNAEYTINVKIDSGEDIAYAVDAEKFTLAPGESKTVIVTVKTDVKRTRKLKHHLQLTAEAVEDSKVTAKAKSISFVEIIPRITGVEDRFHRIPTEVTFRYVSEENNQRTSGIQTEVRGKGTLDEEGKKHIKFGLRGPDVLDKSIFGQRDEYFLSYWTKDHELHFGDRRYCLSRLTENYLYGRGLEGKLHINDDFSLGAYYMKTRWLEPKTEEAAAYIDYSINDRYKVGLNYLRKYRDGKVSNITSFAGELRPFKNTEVELEYALGPGGTKKDNAYLARLYGRNNWLGYYLKLTHGGPDYPGYYSDVDYISGGVTLPRNKPLRLNASFRRQKSNLDLDPSLYSAPLEKYYQLGVDYRLETDTTFSLDWLTRDRRDQLGSPKFDYQEDTFRFGIGQGFDKLSFHTSAELGKTKDKLDNATRDCEKYSASVYFRPTDKQSYSGYLYYDKNSDFTGEDRRNTTIGLNAKYNIAKRTFFSIAFQTNDYQGPARGGRDNLELSLSHTFANNNKLSILARRTRYENSDFKDDTALMVQYTIPIGLPVCKKKSVGSVKGYVYDQETQNAIGNCLLRLHGSTAVTDKAGKFAFFSLKPGLYYLNVDTASIGMNRIPDRKIPIELIVKGGEKTQVDIPVTQAARLFGRIVVHNYEGIRNEESLNEQDRGTAESYYVPGTARNAADTKLLSDYGLPNTIVELKNSSEIKRTVTDRKGHFEFEELRPGRWTVKIYNDNLPEYHYLEKDTFELELKPGQNREISVKVLPRKRRIQIISPPQTTLEEEKK